MRPIIAILALLSAFAFAQTPADQQMARVKGTVVNSITGELVRKVKITLYAENNNRGLTVDSDANGNFWFDTVTPGLHHIDIARTGYVSQTYYPVNKGSMTFEVDPGQQMKDVVLKITPGAVIAGRILDQDGDLRTGGTLVSLQREIRTPSGKRLSTLLGTEANAEGSFVFAGLAPGRYVLMAQPDSAVIHRAEEDADMITYYPDAFTSEAAIPIEVAAAAEFRGADVRVRRGHAVHVRGKLSDPTQNLTVFLAQSGTPTNIPSVATRNGTFDIPNVPPGTYTLSTNTYDFFRGRAWFGRTTITVDQTDLNDVELEVRPPLTVTGNIQIEGHTDGPPSWTILPRVLFRSEVVPFTNGEVLADGSVRANLPPVDQRVIVTPPPELYVKAIRAGGQNYNHMPIDVAALDAGPLEILLSPGAAEINGTVRDENGQPMPGVGVALWSAEDKNPQFSNAREGGVFRFTSLAPGDYFVAAFESGHAIGTTDMPSLFESRASKITVDEGSRATADPVFIFGEEIEELLAKLP